MDKNQSTELLFELSHPGRRTHRLPECDVPTRRIRLPASALADAPPPLPEVGEIDLVRHFVNLSNAEHVHRHQFLSARVVYHEVQPQAARTLGGAAGHGRSASAAKRRIVPGHAGDSLGDAEHPRRDRRTGRRVAAAGRRRPGRIDGPARRGRLLPRQGREAHARADPRQRPRHQSRQRRPRRLRRRQRQEQQPRPGRSRRPARQARRAHRRVHDYQPEHARPVRRSDRRHHGAAASDRARWCISTAPT